MKNAGGQVRNVLANPYFIYNPGLVITGADPYLNTSGRVTVASDLVAGERTLVLVIFGQSLSVNCVQSSAAASQARNHQLNIWDGLIYKTAEPMLGINLSGPGPNYGTWMRRLGDNLIAHGKTDRVVLVPCAVGNTTIAQQIDKSAPPYIGNNINTVAKRIRDVGLYPSAILMGIGESDTNAGTTQVAYAASQTSWIAECNREMPNVPIFIARESYYNGVVSAAVLAAQDAAPNGTTVFAGENCELIPAGERYDNVHINDTGADHRAALVEARLVAVLGL